MNDKGSTTTEDDLRSALAPDGSIAPLDPARVIAGARRRRLVRGVATAAIAAITVGGVATGGILAGGQLLGQAADPADPGPTTLVSPGSPETTPPATPHPSTTPHISSGAVPITVPTCLAALNGQTGPGSNATRRSLLSDDSGTTIVIADTRYWMVCDNTFGQQVSARQPERLQKPTAQDKDAFAVAGNDVTLAAGRRELYWAGGMLPDGVATVRYTFPDGATEDARVDGDFWLMRHVSEQVPPSGPPTTRIRVRLLSASGAVVNDFRLVWGEQTCAQITHGC